MTLIGLEEHFLTAEIRDTWTAIGLDAVDPSVTFHSGQIEGRLNQVSGLAQGPVDYAPLLRGSSLEIPRAVLRNNSEIRSLPRHPFLA
jgi:hypothetical protein